MGKIIALVGSTASGKSDLALELARRRGAHILSCDSLLVYRGMDIGTAKPTPQELASAPHYGIDIADISQEFTAGDYVRYARPILDRLVSSPEPVLIVGGTGFYLKALLCGVWDAPPTQPEIRERLHREVESLPEAARAAALHAKLVARDPEYAAKIMVNDTYRVVRALEIIEASGKTMGELIRTRGLVNPLPYPFRIFGIHRDRAELERRIVQRTDAMFAKGLVNETKSLLAQQQALDGAAGTPPRPLLCVGYFEVLEFLQGRIATVAECRERIVISTRQLAKKQRTFFKGFPAPIEWFTLPSDEPSLVEAVERELAETKKL